ncbi:MAG TPA: glycosyltransferase family 39 protein [Terriglobales bacterium]|nr:glycosyltransferase family 39 protein [Terriglobales bacterium]
MSASLLGQILAAGFTLSLMGSLYRCLKELATNPNGTGWDAFAIWNLHGRFLFRGGEHWRDGFSSLIPWFHPDYPLLLPGSIAHFWSYLGRETTLVPAALAFAFTFSTVALLFSAVSALRGRNQSLLAGVMLLGTPSFLRQGMSQYADIPLGFFLLAAIVLLSLADRVPQSSFSLLALSGFMMGCAAWTKNEGLLFLTAFLVARLGILLARENWPTRLRHMAPLAATIVPILLLIGYFKLSLAPPGELFSSASSMLQKAIEPHRYWMIARWFLRDFLRFGGWILIPGTLLVIAYPMILGKDAESRSGTGMAVSVWTLVLAAIGYFAIYVITPYDLRWHLMWSLDRLFLQLWPSVLFLVFVAVRTPESAMSLGNPEPEGI